MDNTVQGGPGPYAQPRPASTPPITRTLRIPILLVSAVLLLGIGFGIGAATSTSDQKQVTKDRSELASTRAQLSATRDTLTSTRVQLQDARTQASQANANAAAKYAGDEAKLADKERTLASDERAVKAIEGDIQGSAISADGVYVVGKDIKSGTWHTTGDGGQSGNQCYYATLNSTNTSDINDNNNFDGPETVSLDGIYAFQISGPCTWYRTGP